MMSSDGRTPPGIRMFEDSFQVPQTAGLPNFEGQVIVRQETSFAGYAQHLENLI